MLTHCPQCSKLREGHVADAPALFAFGMPKDCQSQREALGSSLSMSASEVQCSLFMLHNRDHLGCVQVFRQKLFKQGEMCLVVQAASRMCQAELWHHMLSLDLTCCHTVTDLPSQVIVCCLLFAELSDFLEQDISRLQVLLLHIKVTKLLGGFVELQLYCI